MRFILPFLFPLAVFAENSVPSESTTESRSVPAEVSSGLTAVKPGRTPEDDLNRRSAALAALRSGHDADAKVQLEGLSSAKTNGPARAFALATDFLRLAFKARSVGDLVAAGRAAQLAWDQLAVAEKEFGKVPRRLAMIQSVRATLLEEFLGTEEEALGYHQKVLDLEPANTGAREKLERAASRRSAGEGLEQTVVQPAVTTTSETTETR